MSFKQRVASFARHPLLYCSYIMNTYFFKRTFIVFIFTSVVLLMLFRINRANKLTDHITPLPLLPNASESIKDITTPVISKIKSDQIDNLEIKLASPKVARLIPIKLGNISLLASRADTNNARELGLSGTTYLPEDEVKLFIFETSEKWNFWMKDMNYPIDIIWLDEHKKVVHIENNVKFDSYPNLFLPPVPAKYVIETNAGFAAAKQILLGTEAEW